jgi:hypothetical protein
VIEYLNHDHQYIRIFKCAYIDIQNWYSWQQAPTPAQPTTASRWFDVNYTDYSVYIYIYIYGIFQKLDSDTLKYRIPPQH